MARPKLRYERTLQAELDELERTDPKVKAAAESYDNMVREVQQDRKHPLPCQVPNCIWHKGGLPS